MAKNNMNGKITKAALLGQAVGDALGVPVEFMSREEVRKVNLTEMIGKDTPMAFESRWSELIPAGAWSDDTSMTVTFREDHSRMRKENTAENFAVVRHIVLNILKNIDDKLSVARRRRRCAYDDAYLQKVILSVHA